MVMNRSYALLYITRKKWAKDGNGRVQRAWGRYQDLSNKIYIPARVMTATNVMTGAVYVRRVYFMSSKTWPAFYYKRKAWKTANSWILSIR